MAKIHWEMTYETWETYTRLRAEAYEAQERGDAIQLAQAVDQLRSLPGYPMNIHPTEDIVVPAPPRSSLTIVPKRRLTTL